MSEYVALSVKLTCAWIVVCAMLEHSGECQDVWVESSMVKVLQEDKPRAGHTVLEWHAARNEYVAGQVVIRAGSRALSNVAVAVSDLTQQSHDKVPFIIKADRISLFKVHYVYLSAPGHSESRDHLVTTDARHYPDALPPFAPFTLQAHTTQPIWISLITPSDTPPGDYRGTVCVSIDQMKIAVIPVRLHIWKFELPDAPSIRSIISGALSSENKSGHEAEAIRRRYYEFWLERRISSQDMPVALDSPLAIGYYHDPRLTAFRIGQENRGDQPDRYTNMLSLWSSHGVLKKAVVRSIDEPRKQEQFARITQLSTESPAIKQIVCFNRPVPGDWAKGKNFFDLIGDGLDIWCPITQAFSDPEIREYAAKRRALGDEVWWYVCSWPKPPYANFLIDGNGVEPRILFWMKWLYRIDGFLHWGGARWRGANPYKTAATRADEWPNLYGDGYLVYPGAPVEVWGPVSSIRLENIRDGIEDHMYLTLLSKLEGGNIADKLAGRVVRNLTEYCRDAETIETVRREIGELLNRHASDLSSAAR